MSKMFEYYLITEPLCIMIYSYYLSTIFSFKSSYPTPRTMDGQQSLYIDSQSPNSDSQPSADLESEVVALREENQRLQEESQSAAQQLRRFTEWFFQNAQPEDMQEISTTESNTH